MALAMAFLSFTTATGIVTNDAHPRRRVRCSARRARSKRRPFRRLPPNIVPPAVLPQTMAGLSSAYQAATIAGPALGGILLIARTGLCLCHLRDAVFHLKHIHLDDPHATQRAVAARAGHARGAVRRHSFRAQESDRARRDVARPVRRASSAARPHCCRSLRATFFDVGTWGLGIDARGAGASAR